MKFLRYLCLLLAFLMCFISFSGCEAFKKPYPVTVAGVTVESAPQKVAVLTDAAASYITTLGYGSYLFGAPTTYVNKNKSNSALVDLGSALLVDEDALLELSPDVLITSNDLSTGLNDKLTLRNVKVIKLKTPETYDEVKNYFAELIKLFVGEKEYEEVKTTFLTEMDNKLKTIKAANTNTDKKVAVFVEQNFVVTGDTLAGSLLDMAGINNIAKDGENYIMTKEIVASNNPDIIFCAKGTVESILKADAYKEVTAIKNAAVYEIDVTGLLYGCDGFAALQDMVTYINQ